MRQRRNYLGVEEKNSEQRGSGDSCRFKLKLLKWLERQDTSVSLIYKSVQGVPKALEIVEQYNREKEVLPANNPNKEVLAKELIERLIVRFRGKIQDELGDLNKKQLIFIIQSDEKVCTEFDRLNGIIQKPHTTGTVTNRLIETRETQRSA